MKTKFETNVASELPKTRQSQEPGLPWKVSGEDMDKVASIEGEYRSAITGAAPFKARASFLVALIITIFIATLYFVSNTVMEGEKIQNAISKKERLLASLKKDLDKMNTENSELNKSVTDLQKKVGELTAQKDLFTAVVESLAKKTDAELAQKTGKTA